ncbi:hypothetical protein L3Y34_019765 [Caenorhabditis briggsae]|uniref:Uncharacterized protein n=1 Tax=Caenorhabditis briggsae TaxID=6238 RepID=A0AAE9DQ67_CAEBR|nr:hypothetical protein L3Y34_019765 [Caenorhabditis briggsae]
MDNLWASNGPSTNHQRTSNGWANGRQAMGKQRIINRPNQWIPSMDHQWESYRQPIGKLWASNGPSTDHTNEPC